MWTESVSVGSGSLGGLMASTFSIGLLVERVAEFVVVVDALGLALVFVWAKAENENRARRDRTRIIVARILTVFARCAKGLNERCRLRSRELFKVSSQGAKSRRG